MKILVTNDDGIFAQGLWTLARELKNIAEVVVSAPERGDFAMGTAVSAGRQGLRPKRVQPVVPEIETYCVKGTPADSVIFALHKLVKEKIDLIIAGINYGSNMEYDVFASGTVGAALIGWHSGLPALSISVDYGDNPPLDTAAKLAVALAKRIESGALPSNIFLNINLPNLPLAKIKGIKTTYVAKGVYTDTFEEKRDGRRVYYQGERYRGNRATDEGTDVWAVQQGYISILPLHRFICPMFNEPSPYIPDTLWSDLFHELQQ